MAPTQTLRPPTQRPAQLISGRSTGNLASVSNRLAERNGSLAALPSLSTLGKVQRRNLELTSEHYEPRSVPTSLLSMPRPLAKKEPNENAMASSRAKTARVGGSASTQKALQGTGSKSTSSAVKVRPATTTSMAPSRVGSSSKIPQPDRQKPRTNQNHTGRSTPLSQSTRSALTSSPPFSSGQKFKIPASRSGVDLVSQAETQSTAGNIKATVGAITVIDDGKSASSRVSENIVAEYEARLEELREQLRMREESKERQLVDLRNQLSVKDAEVNALASQVLCYQTESEANRMERAELEQNLQSQVQNLCAQVERMEELVSKKDSEMESLRASVDDIQKRLQDSEAASDELSKRLASQNEELEDLRLQCSSLKEQLETAATKCTTLAEERDHAKKELVALKKKHSDERNRIIDQAVALEKAIKEKESEVNSWQAMTDLKSEEIRKLKKELEDARGIVDAHEKLESEYNKQRFLLDNLELTVSACKTAQKEALEKAEKREQELQELRRRSTVLVQEKETLKFQLDKLTEDFSSMSVNHDDSL